MKRLVLIFCVLFSICIVAEAQKADIEVATLEELTLDENCHYPSMTDENGFNTTFTSGSFKFESNYMSEYSSWWGFGYSNISSTSFSSLADQFNSCTGKGYGDSDTYGIAYVASYMGPTYVHVNTYVEKVVPGVYVTNSAYAINSMTNGDSFAKKFGNGDWFKLTAIGYSYDEDEDGFVESKRIDFYLADLTSKNEEDWYILDDWAYFDLSSLGNVGKIQFDLSSSDTGDWGMNTPAYFCYDNLGATGTQTAIEGNWSKFNSKPTSINMVSSSDIKYVEYYNLSGQKINGPHKGVCIEKTTYSDGKVSSRKIVK